MAPRPGEEHNHDVEEDVMEISLDSQPAQSTMGTTQDGSTTIGVGSYAISIDNAVIPFMGQLVAAVILIVAVLVPDDKLKNHGFGLTVGIVSNIFALMGIFVTTRREIGEQPLGFFPMVGELTWAGFVAHLAFIWWFVGAAVLTFNDPFTVTSNGYFACWAGVAFAAMAMGVTADALRQQSGALFHMNALLVAAIVQICAILKHLGGDFKGDSIYSLIVCIITILALLAFRSSPGMESMQLYFFALFAILWVVLACLVTFRGPFIATGNGYFSAWAGCLLCLMAANSLRTT